jgi:16S rRNA (guanine527-N7)-methyltransferase
MQDENRVRELLEPFDLRLNATQIHQVLVYLDLLLRWNAKINLTSIRSGDECVTRHFGESLYLARSVSLRGRLLDIGSGAGFPGLALRIAFPDLKSTLLEPVAKKRTFLKEVARACYISAVDVLPNRLEDFVRQSTTGIFDTVTARAIGHLETVIPQALRLLGHAGQICLWLGENQGLAVRGSSELIEWGVPIKIPLSREREILVGTRKSD